MSKFRGTITIKDFQFAFPRTNFSGERFNDGKRSFNIRLDDPEVIDKLQRMGMDIREWHGQNAGPDDEPIRHIPVKVNYRGDKEMDPIVWLINGKTGSRNMLDEESISRIDRLQQTRSITRLICTLNIREYDPNPMNPNGGCTAYCQKLVVYFEPDEIDMILAGEDISNEDVPF